MEIIRNIKSIPRWVPKSVHNCPFVCAVLLRAPLSKLLAANVATGAATVKKRIPKKKKINCLVSAVADR